MTKLKIKDFEVSVSELRSTELVIVKNGVEYKGILTPSGIVILNNQNQEVASIDLLSLMKAALEGVNNETF